MAEIHRQKKKGGNKHASNLRRHERKYKPRRGVVPPGNCGSSFCSARSGCDPWK